MPRLPIIGICLLLALPCLPQIGIDKPLQFDGQAPSDRQLRGVPSVSTPGALQSAAQEQGGTHRSMMAPSGTAWSLALPALAAPPTPGMNVVVTAPDAIPAGPVTLDLNGTGPYPLVWRAGAPIDGAAIAGGTLLSLVFDGTAYHVMNGLSHRRKECPDGMMAATSQFCIDLDERSPISFFDAAAACTQEGKRLCTWGEWFNACQLRTALGLANMVNNWEYTDDTANEDNSVRLVGPNCSNATAWYVSNEHQSYRCCYTR